MRLFFLESTPQKQMHVIGHSVKIPPNIFTHPTSIKYPKIETKENTHNV